MNSPTELEFLEILKEKHKEINIEILQTVINLTKEINNLTDQKNNLRDLLRFCDLLNNSNLNSALHLTYLNKEKNLEEKRKVGNIIEKYFQEKDFDFDKNIYYMPLKKLNNGIAHLNHMKNLLGKLQIAQQTG